MSTCRKLRVTSRLPSSRPDDVTTPSFWCLSELLHVVFTHKLNLWYVTALFAVMNLSLFTLVCLKLQGSEPLCRHTPAISSQCKRQGIIVYSSRSLWLSHPNSASTYGRSSWLSHPNSASIRQVLVEPESSAYPPQSCPFGGCVHVPITAPSTPGTGLLGKTPTYPSSYRTPMVLHCPCVTVYILISTASFLTYLIVISTELCILLHRSEKSPKYLLFTITLFCY